MKKENKRKKPNTLNKKPASGFKISYLIVLILIIALISITFILYGYKNKTINDKKRSKDEEIAHRTAIIKSHYAKRVSLVKDADIYEKDGKNFNDIGDISKGYFISLDEVEINENTLYFPVADSKYYLKYDTVIPQEGINEYIDFNYVLFNKNAHAKAGAPLYQNGKEVLRYNKEKTYPILIKEDDHYIVKYREELFKLLKTDVSKTTDANNTNEAVASSIPILNYHFLYDHSKNDYCRESICLRLDYFESHLKYLKDNEFYSLKMEEMAMWMDKKIRLPKKSVAITFDDGTLKTDEYLPASLDKYEVNGVLFLVTSWFDYKMFASPYLEVQSHGHKLHGITGNTSKGLAMNDEQIDKDFKDSIASLDGADDAFAYPYYQYNNTMLRAVKDNFKIAFIGGNRRAKQSDNRYLLPRIVIYSGHDLKRFKSLVN